MMTFLFFACLVAIYLVGCELLTKVAPALILPWSLLFAMRADNASEWLAKR